MTCIHHYSIIQSSVTELCALSFYLSFPLHFSWALPFWWYIMMPSLSVQLRFPSLRISCFSKELGFQLVGNSIRDQDLNTRCTLSVERTRKYMCIYTHMYVDLYTNLMCLLSSHKLKLSNPSCTQDKLCDIIEHFFIEQLCDKWLRKC